MGRSANLAHDFPHFRGQLLGCAAFFASPIKKGSPARPFLNFLNQRDHRLDVAATEAAALVAEADVAAAAVLAAGLQALAHRLQHVAALGVAAGAGQRAAFFGPLIFAFAAGQVETANLHSVADAAATTFAIANRVAHHLKIFTGQRIIAAAANAEATHELLERQLASHRVAHVHLRRTELELNLGLFWKLSHHVAGHN